MKEGECDSWRDCMANRFSTVQITVKYCCIFVLLFRWYLLQLDNKKQYRINGIQYNTIQYNTIRYNTIQYNTIQYRASNNFLAGAGQIVWSNLFLLGHIPFLAKQTSIMSYCYRSAPSPLPMMFKYETSKFSEHLLYMSIDLNAGKVELMVHQNQHHICVKICNNSRHFYDYYESFTKSSWSDS